MRSLQLTPAAKVSGLSLSQCGRHIFPESPAIAAVLDLTFIPPPCIRSDMLAVQAREIMINEHSTFRLVVDDFSALVGVVTTEDVCEQHIMQWVATGFQRHEVLVKYLMQPRATLMTLRYKDLDGWSAGEVASALQKDGAQHCLVLNDTNTQLRGIISARELGVHVGDSKELQRASTIAGLVASLHL